MTVTRYPGGFCPVSSLGSALFQTAYSRRPKIPGRYRGDGNRLRNGHNGVAGLGDGVAAHEAAGSNGPWLYKLDRASNRPHEERLG